MALNKFIEIDNNRANLKSKPYYRLVDAYFKFDNVSFDIIKRGFDILYGLVGTVMLIPISIVIKLFALASGDHESIFFTQNRIGKDGKEFKLYKYRSMKKDADYLLEKLLKEDPNLAYEYSINKKLHDDPRVTKIGKVIRALSIDELPQFVNVLKGDMSLIGNRPYLPREKEDMGYRYHKIVSTKPGITGYWQVSGRNDVSFKKRLELEEYYSDYYSIQLDTYIFFKTFLTVFFRKGAK